MHNPFVPESLEGWSVLHLMYRVRWPRLRAAAAGDLQRMADEAEPRAGGARTRDRRRRFRCSGTRAI